MFITSGGDRRIKDYAPIELNPERVEYRPKEY
jgi:hypothetical protein